MDNLVNRWRCDHCGEWVTPDGGYVVWDKDESGAHQGFRIIHQVQCDKGEESSSSALKDFLGEDGFVRATALMARGPILGRVSTERSRVADEEEYIDFLRRLYVPNYEEARPRFRDRDVIEEHHGTNEVWSYTQQSLRQIASPQIAGRSSREPQNGKARWCGLCRYQSA